MLTGKEQGKKYTEQIFFELQAMPVESRRIIRLTFEYPGVKPTTIPCCLLKGDSASPRLWLEALIHGDEYDGALACLDFINNLDLHDLHGTVLVFPVINPTAFFAYQHGSPYDGNINLNRVFFENDNTGYSWEYGRFLLELAENLADFFIDYHGGSKLNDISRYCMVPNVGNEVDSYINDLARKCGLQYIFCDHNDQNGNTGRLIVALAKKGIPGILLENGGGIAWDKDCVERHVESVRYLMVETGFLKCGEHAPESGFYFEPEDYVYCEHDGLLLYHIPLGSSINKGDVCLKYMDVETGEIFEVTCPKDGCFVYCIHTAAVVRKGNFAMAYAKYPEGVMTP
nr:succinylglutamate desuccinylase/aspartoacylase family protein [Lachnospiraceae bacterium]